MLQLSSCRFNSGRGATIHLLRKAPGNLHYWLSLLLALALVPLSMRLHLSLRFDWIGLGSAYWLLLAAQAIFAATLLYVVGMGPRQALHPLLKRCQAEKLRIVLTLGFFLGVLWATTWLKAVVLTVDALALLEYRDRFSSQKLRQAGAAILPPAAYLFFGFLLIFAWNDVIVSLRFFGQADPIFFAMDSWLLHGGSVSSIAHWAVRSFPISFFHFLEFVYLGMFPQIGAGLILSSVYGGRRRGLQFVGTILMAYYVALLIFCLWPSQGPYLLCPDHFSRFPTTLRAYATQKTLIAVAQGLGKHLPRGRISFDYFIGFPCMHIAQPLVVMWFLRRWKKMVIALAAYDALLVAAIVFLEWHYLVDILGGILVAVIAIVLTDRDPSHKVVAPGVARTTVNSLS